MTLQTSGQISAQDIIVEEAIQLVDTFNINTTLSRTLAKRTSGQIAFSDFYGKSSVVPGCVVFSTSTSYQIPAYNYMLTIEVWGAGGSGGNSDSRRIQAASGSYSVAKLNGGWIVGYGGAGGQSQLSWRDSRGHKDGYGGAGGSTSGGDIMLKGYDGAAGVATVPGRGGDSPRGGAGGTGYEGVGGEGGFPGGGGGGTGEGNGQGKFSWDAGGGGGGGYSAKNVLKGSGYAPPYSTAIIEIGAPGRGEYLYGSERGGDGGGGYCRICVDMGLIPPFPAGTFLASFCSGYALYYTLADGNNGAYNQLVNAYSPACGYVAPPDTGGYTEPTCFPAGTPVIMADGTEKMIEDVLIGDQVLGAYGEANTILAYDRVTLGIRPMYLINQEHRTTDTHTHITDRNTLASLLSDTHGLDGTEQSLGFATFYPTQTDLLGTMEMIMLPGLPIEDLELLEELKIGTILKTINGNKTVETITSYTMPADTILYNFIVGGSHTYHVDGYAVTGFANGRDFDYRTWTYKTDSWTLDDYRNFKG